MDAKTLESRLTSADGFKPLFSGFSAGKKAKKSFALYDSAAKKGVFDLITLREAENDDVYYGIYAFSTKGDIDDGTLAELKSITDQLDLGLIRYESGDYSQLELLAGPDGSSRGENTEIISIADDFEDVIIIADVEFSGKVKWDKPLAIYAEVDGKDYVFPVPAVKL